MRREVWRTNVGVGVPSGCVRFLDGRYGLMLLAEVFSRSDGEDIEACGRQVRLV